jgi:molybdenum cofactor cytidylyltransferase
MAIPAIILAAGGSRRLGRPKQLVPVGNETLLGRTIRVVREAGADPVLVVLGAHRDEIVAGIDLKGVQVIFHSEWEEGIASSIRAGLVALRAQAPDATPAMLLVCDQPRLTNEHVHRLIATFDEQSEPTIVASAYADIAGIPAIFPANEFAALLELRGEEGARRLLRDPGCPLITVGFEGGDFDVDTPADLAQIISASKRRSREELR